MNNIPAEIWDKLFKLLTLDHLCKVRIVCKYWNTIAEDQIRRKKMWLKESASNKLLDILKTKNEYGFSFPTVYESFHLNLKYLTLDYCKEFVNIYGKYANGYSFTGYSNQHEQVKSFLFGSPNVVILKFDESFDSTFTLTEDIPQLQSLLHLEITTKMSRQLIYGLLNSTPKIKTVKLHVYSDGISKAHEILSIVPEFSRLDLRLTFDPHVGPELKEDETTILALLSKRVEVESFYISYNWNFDILSLFVNDSLQNCRNTITKFCVRFDDGWVRVVGHLSKITLPFLPNLHSLDVGLAFSSYNDVIDFDEIVENQFPKLKKLKLYVYRIDDNLPKLNYLKLEEVSIMQTYNWTGDSGRENFRKFLASQSETLQKLDIYPSFYPLEFPVMKMLESFDFCLFDYKKFPEPEKFPSLKKISLDISDIGDSISQESVYPTVTKLSVNGSRRKIEFPQNILNIFPNLSSISLDPTPNHLKFIFTNLNKLKTLIITFWSSPIINEDMIFWNTITGINKNDTNPDQQLNPSLGSMKDLECLELNYFPVEYVDPFLYMTKTMKMAKLKKFRLTSSASAEETEFQSTLEILKSYHERVLYN